MTDTTPAPAARRWYFSIPLLGRIARDVDASLWLAIVLLASLVVIAVLTWGLPALGLIAVGSVPLVFVVLLLITQG